MRFTQRFVVHHWVFQKSEKIGISSFYMSNWNQNDPKRLYRLWISNDRATQNLEALASMFDIISGSLGQRDLAQLEQKTVCKTWSPFIPSLGSSKRHDHIASIYIDNYRIFLFMLDILHSYVWLYDCGAVAWSNTVDWARCCTMMCERECPMVRVFLGFT